MTECNDTNMRDLLPDLVGGRLAAAELAVVESHVESCPECTDDVVLLRLARSVRPRALAIDVGRIVAALPARTVSATTDSAPVFTGPRLVRDPSSAAAHPVAARRTRSLGGAWRMAAAIGVAVIGGWSALMYRGGSGTEAPAAVAQAGPIAMPPSETLAVLDDVSGTSGSESGESGAAAVLTPRELEVPLTNHLSEYSDEDLLQMLDRLEKWDGATSADPLPTVPIVSVAPRGTL